MSAPLAEIALGYLAAGLRPIPAVPRKKVPGDARGMWAPKHPEYPGWHEWQTRPPTEAEVLKWFADESVNIGTVIPPGVVVLDFDGGKDAERLLLAAGVTLPEDAPRVVSGSGGCHAYLRLPEGTKDFPKLPGAKFLHAFAPDGKPCKPFVEVLTMGNFVVLPPSIHPNGKPYTWAVEL